MSLPLLLCMLIAVTSGLHFGRRFLQAYLTGRSPLLPALAHMAISAVLMVLSVLVDTTPSAMLWMIVATASMAGLALGALLPQRPHTAAPVAERPAEVAPLQAA